MFQSKSDAGFCVMKLVLILKKFSTLHEEVLDDWAKRQRRKKVERADQNNGPEQENKKRSAMHWKRAGAGGRDLLLHKRSGQRHDRHDHQKPADQHGHAEGRVIPGRISGETGKCAAIIPGAGAEGVENLTQAVRTVVVQSGQSPICSLSPRQRIRESRRRGRAMRASPSSRRTLQFFFRDIPACGRPSGQR